MENNGAGRKFLLKPAKFQSSKPEESNGKSSENGAAPTFLTNNPFLKCDKDEQETAKHDENGKDPEKSDSPPTDLFKPAKSNLFVQSSALSENSNFVFGQNLHARVVIDKVNSSEDGDADEPKDAEQSTTGGHLFSAALTKSKSPEKESCSADDSTQESTEDKTKKLVENAKNYEEMKSANKRKFEEVQTTTGEEDEKNALEINCKLFTFIDNNYEERGRGSLRLNDAKDASYSRVVFRSTGVHKVLMNTKVFRDQVCEKPSPKSLRLTAIGADGVAKIYLVMGRPEDIVSLYSVLTRRIEREKERSETSTVEHDEPEVKKSAISPE